MRWRRRRNSLPARDTTRALAFSALLLTSCAICSTCAARHLSTSSAIRASAPTPELVSRGAYLVNEVSSCGFCHTPRVGSTWRGAERDDAFLAGGSVFDVADMGFRIVAPNITQDRETGIGSWTDDEIVRAIREGVGLDGRRLMPPMPFASFRFMSDDDARAIVAFLRTVPPVKNVVSRDANRIPLLLRLATKLGLLHYGAARDVQAPDRAKKRQYGAYLTKVGLCWECHSLGRLGPTDDEDMLMSGSRRPLSEPEFGRIYARNLTPHPKTGLGRYTPDQIKSADRKSTRLNSSH